MTTWVLRTAKFKDKKRWHGHEDKAEPVRLSSPLDPHPPQVGGGLAGAVMLRACKKLNLPRIHPLPPLPAPSLRVRHLMASSPPLSVALVQDGRHQILEVEGVPEQLLALREALLGQQAVNSLSSVHVVPAPLPALLPALLPLVVQAVEEGGHQGVQLVCEPSRWEGEDAALFPPPAALHAALSSALSQVLRVPVGRARSEGVLLVTVEVGREQCYVSWSREERVPPRHFTSLKAGSKAVLFVMGEVHLKQGRRQEMINEVMRTVRYRLGGLASWSEAEGACHYLAYPTSEAQLPLLLRLVAAVPGVERAWIATRTDLTVPALFEAARPILDHLGAWRSLNLLVRVRPPPSLPLASDRQELGQGGVPEQGGAEAEAGRGDWTRVRAGGAAGGGQ